MVRHYVCQTSAFALGCRSGPIFNGKMARPHDMKSLIKKSCYKLTCLCQLIFSLCWNLKSQVQVQFSFFWSTTNVVVVGEFRYSLFGVFKDCWKSTLRNACESGKYIGFPHPHRSTTFNKFYATYKLRSGLLLTQFECHLETLNENVFKLFVDTYTLIGKVKIINVLVYLHLLP